MAKKEEIQYVEEHLFCPSKKGFAEKVRDRRLGIGAVLHYLHCKNEPATAGEISSFLGVSSARVAVLLARGEEKGLLSVERKKEDARVKTVSLSPFAEEKCRQFEESIHTSISHVIDELGMEKIEEFLALRAEIKQALEKYKPQKPIFGEEEKAGSVSSNASIGTIGSYSP